MFDFLNEGFSKVVDSISSGLDELFTSDDERAQMRLLVKKEINNLKIAQMAALEKYDAEISKRWISDNEHTITRLVRPLSFIFIQALFAGIVLFDGNIGGFEIKESYIPVIESLLLTMVIAYFGSRGAEKLFKK